MRFTDARRKHQHFEALIVFESGERFVRVYTEKERARNFTARMKKSPTVAKTRVREINRIGGLRILATKRHS